MSSGYEKRLVAFLDILGFKEYINKTEDFEEIFSIFTTIAKSNNEYAPELLLDDNNGFNTHASAYNKALFDSKVYIMSDSIVVSTPERFPESLAVLIDICNYIQQKLYDCRSVILLRGAVASGEYYQRKGIVFGKALVNAYVAQENYAKYPRIIINAEILNKRMSSLYGEILPKDKDGYYYIPTLENYLRKNGTLGWEDIVISDDYKRIRNLIDRNLGGYQTQNVREKYIWLEQELKRIEELTKRT